MRKLRLFRKGLALVALSTLLVTTPVVAKTNSFVSSELKVTDKTGDMDEEDELTLVRSSSKKINGITFSVSFSRGKNANTTRDDQIELLEKLFYQVYPQMYDRFGGYKKSPTKIDVEFVHDYKYAGGSIGDKVYLNDAQFKNNLGYDCFTHELAHALQNVWDDKTKRYYDWDRSKLEYDDFVENFAEYCRYVYGYNDGEYNDKGWELKSVKQGEDTRDNSDRFLLWLDWETTSSNKDIVRDFYEICTDGSFSRSQWHDKVWPILFKGTRFEGRNIDDVWKEYRNSDFSHYGTKSTNGYTPEIIRECKRGGEDIRTYLKNHSFSQKYEDGM
ncbi:MAG: hypothetical protein IKS48_06570 [Eubacterium sp.]|nr:hypothetical protein [Eubacterium sp.]